GHRPRGRSRWPDGVPRNQVHRHYLVAPRPLRPLKRLPRPKRFTSARVLDGMARTSEWCSRHGWLVGLVWGLAESTVFFIVPDVGVAFIAAMSPKRWWVSAVTSVLGTLLGTVMLFLAIHLWLGAHATDLLLRIPGIR